jgi:ribosome assembly protein YihI (activator of Der GTPase)
METPLAKSLAIVIPGYRMHSQTFNNMLDGMQETDAQTRIENKTNHFTWMVGNLVNCRYWLADILGIAEKDPNEHLFKDAKALDINARYPSLDELNKEWHKISPLVYQKLLLIEDAELMEAYEFGMNISYVEENKLNMVGMCLDRESYLFGQLGLMRKLLNYPGVRYDLDDHLSY